MSITIDFPPATERRLRAQVAATGKDLNTLVVEAVDARLSIAGMNLRTILEPVHEDFRRNNLSEPELDDLLKEGLSESRSERKA
jgi:hypothetical protein